MASKYGNLDGVGVRKVKHVDDQSVEAVRACGGVSSSRNGELGISKWRLHNSLSVAPRAKSGIKPASVGGCLLLTWHNSGSHRGNACAAPRRIGAEI